MLTYQLTVDEALAQGAFFTPRFPKGINLPAIFGALDFLTSNRLF